MHFNLIFQEITPHLQTVGVEKPALKLLSTVINVLSKNVWPQVNPPTRKEKFCWGVVNTFCERIQPRQDSFHWAESFEIVIEKMGEIYGLYCQKRNMKRESEHCILQEKLRSDICRSAPESRRYYMWVQQIHKVFSNWYSKIMQNAINHDDMLDLAKSHSSICKVAKAVCAMSKIVPDEYIAKMKKTYLEDFEKLNVLLLRYVPEVPRAKWYVLVFSYNLE